jgi:phage N-6-adenine-methyltransferase
MNSTSQKILFSSQSDEWETPQALYDKIDFIYNFTLDVCATAENKKCARYFDRKTDGLAQSWSGERCWMNPPYGRKIGEWMRKAYEESLTGALVVCLVPARTDTAWWHNYVQGTEVTFLRGRLKFQQNGKDGKSSAPFPSAIVVFKPYVNNRDIKQENDT